MTHPEAKDAARSARPTDDLTSPAAIERLRARDRRFVAAAITELERLTPRVTQLLEALQPHLGKALVIGFTGPPGAGKSTLVNALIRVLRAHDKTVGVIAVDPSSPVSGGAILGDRIRMTAALDDDGVFVRSLASRGYLGGLSPAAVRIIDALDAAGYDVIILETVGTGQNEIDVAEVADVRVVISAPGLGDDIQAMKSGLLEIADILVVNKGDREGAERTLQQLVGALSIRAGAAAKVPVLKTTATTGAGVEDLDDARMPQASRDLRFLEETLELRCVRRAGVQELDGELPLRDLVAGQPHGAHAALSQLAQDAVLAPHHEADLHGT